MTTENTNSLTNNIAMTTLPTTTGHDDGSVTTTPSTTTTIFPDDENENEREIVVNENTNNSNNDNDDNNNSKKTTKTVSKKDIVFYFLCGILADALPGFFLSTTIISELHIPNGSPAIVGLCASIGALIGNIVATFLLVKLNPNVRVIINALIQVLGILLAWLLDYPSNVIAGISILAFGFAGMLTTIMPLSNYAGEMATRSYQVGFGAAPVLGIGIVEMGVGIGFETATGYFAIAMVLPILTALSFFCLDHSVWTKAAIEINSNNDHSYHQSDDDNDQEQQSSQPQPQPQPQSQPDREQERESRVSLFVHDYDNTETLSVQDYKIGIKEIVFRYIPIYVVNFCVFDFWKNVLYQPSFISSSASYHGLDGEQSMHTSDNILLVSHVCVFVIGLTIFTCLGTIIPQKLSPYWLWIPNLCQTILLLVTLSGVAYGAFPPLSIGAVYTINAFMFILMFCVYLYTPLFVRNDKRLSPQYREFHQQVLLSIMSATQLLIAILSQAWWKDAVLFNCRSNYEDVYNTSNSNNNTTSCTFFN